MFVNQFFCCIEIIKTTRITMTLVWYRIMISACSMFDTIHLLFFPHRTTCTDV